MLCGGAPVSRCCRAQGCQCVRQPLAHRGAAAMGARNDDRSIICSARRYAVDSDAVCIRARHGGRHEGGGRRQRKRDEELVHLSCAYCKVQCRVLAQTSDSANWQCSSPLRKTRNRPSGDLKSNFRTPGVHLRQRDSNSESAGRARDAQPYSPPPLTPSPRRDLYHTGPGPLKDKKTTR